MGLSSACQPFGKFVKAGHHNRLRLLIGGTEEASSLGRVRRQAFCKKKTLFEGGILNLSMSPNLWTSCFATGQHPCIASIMRTEQRSSSCRIARRHAFPHRMVHLCGEMMLVIPGRRAEAVSWAAKIRCCIGRDNAERIAGGSVRASACTFSRWPSVEQASWRSLPARPMMLRRCTIPVVRF